MLDALLDAAPDYASPTQQREFQTELLRSLMNHLLAADALLGDQGALAVAAGGTQQNLTLNIFYVAQRVVDKLWQGKRRRLRTLSRYIDDDDDDDDDDDYNSLHSYCRCNRCR